MYAVLLLPALFVYGQGKSVSTPDSLNQKKMNWYNLSPAETKIQGAAVDQAYASLLSGKTPAAKIIVAVIDGGVDINHPELQGRVWTNTDEIPGNGIDDDHNGYVDDVHGWNFIGGADGEDVLYENLEYARIYRELNPEFGMLANGNQLSGNERKLYETFIRCRDKYRDELAKQEKREKSLAKFVQVYEKQDEVLKNYLKKDVYSEEDIKGIKTRDENVLASKTYMLDLYKKHFTPEDLKGMQKRNQENLKYYLNLDFYPRKLIGDNPADITDSHYGNNDVTGPRSFHGTFVSGIIAAGRDNGIGTNGIAMDVAIMPVRVVPDGDERDKDVALAIRYAVDNGAKVINMSFGKYFSIHQDFVDDALRYADAHNVLMIHAAGNDAEDIDTEVHYPSSILSDGTIVNNWLTVGATNEFKGKEFCAVFTNYGKKTVDLFAPGVDLISLYPGNKYNMGSGTSFSAPVVAGVAALVWSYYPGLSAAELKDVLLQSCVFYPDMKVYQPGTYGKNKIKTPFGSLSRTGGIVNAYKALLKADEVTRSH